MLYIANPCASTAVTAAMTAGRIGYIDTPAQGNVRPPGMTWCADNGCFSDQWDERQWWQWLTANASDAASCLFAVAPDIVADGWRSHMRSQPWLRPIRELGYRVAYVAQNGTERHPLPWWEFDCLFLGGSLQCVPCGYVYREPRRPKRNEPCPRCSRRLTEWKLGEAARHLVAEAKRRGKWVHMGRVNSEKRWRYASAIGCDSADGTYLVFGPDRNLPHVLAWARNADQPALFGGLS